jgi:hypothetical protein
MFLDVALVVFCLVLVLLIMVFFINPPEAWIKKVFHGKDRGCPLDRRK